MCCLGDEAEPGAAAEGILQEHLWCHLFNVCQMCCLGDEAEPGAATEGII
jgi:hypothetical protein